MDQEKVDIVLSDLEERFRFSEKYDALILSYELYRDGVQLWRYDRIIDGENVNTKTLKFYRDDAVEAANRETGDGR